MKTTPVRGITLWASTASALASLMGYGKEWSYWAMFLAFLILLIGVAMERL